MRATPISLFPREELRAWEALAGLAPTDDLEWRAVRVTMPRRSLQMFLGSSAVSLWPAGCKRLGLSWDLLSFGEG